MEREVRFLLEKCHRSDLTIYQNDVEGFLAAQASTPLKLDQVEAQVQQTFRNISLLDDNKRQLIAARNASIEEKCVVESASMALFANNSTSYSTSLLEIPSERRADPFLLDASPNGVEEELIGTPFVAAGGGGSSSSSSGGTTSMVFNNAAGVINQVEQERFAKFVFRSTRGNAFTHFRQITEVLTDPKTGEECQKSVFVVYYQGNSNSAMHGRILKACRQFGANTYPWVSTAAQAREKLRAITQEASEKERALMASERLMRDELLHILERQPGSYNSLLEDWRLFLLKEKGVHSFFIRSSNFFCDKCKSESVLLTVYR